MKETKVRKNIMIYPSVWDMLTEHHEANRTRSVSASLDILLQGGIALDPVTEVRVQKYMELRGISDMSLAVNELLEHALGGIVPAPETPVDEDDMFN